ncbi:MAG: hypothetical protein HS103_06120 [Anaerolineales bacterium]|nr:hypothetical protein [Anaerolineales bacterium]
MTMVARAALGEVPTEQVIVSAVILTLTVAGFVLLAARLFRVNSLLSGQMPKLRDILKLVRESLRSRSVEGGVDYTRAT